MIIRAINNWVTVRVSCSEYSGLEREVSSWHIPSSAYIYPVFPWSSSVHLSGTAQPTMMNTAIRVRYEGSVNMISVISGNLADMECAVEMFWVQLSSPLSFLLVLISGRLKHFLPWHSIRSAWPLSYSFLPDLLATSLPSSTSPSRPENVSLIFSTSPFIHLSIPPLWPGLQTQHKLTRICWCALKERKQDTGQQGALWKSPFASCTLDPYHYLQSKPLWAVVLLGFLLVLQKFDSNSQSSCVSHMNKPSGSLASLSGSHPRPSLCILVFSEVFKRRTGTESILRRSFQQKAVLSTASLAGLLRLHQC